MANNKGNKITYDKFVEELTTNIFINKPQNIRLGQALMNYLWQVNPGEYIRISSLYYYDNASIDCSYKDDLIPNTLKHLKEVWNT